MTPERRLTPAVVRAAGRRPEPGRTEICVGEKMAGRFDHTGVGETLRRAGEADIALRSTSKDQPAGTVVASTGESAPCCVVIAVKPAGGTFPSRR